MAAREATDRVLYLFAGARTDIERTPAAANCKSLRDWVLQDPMETFHEEWYLRYIHGYRAVAIALLEVMPVETARAVMKVASYGVFVIAILMNLYFLGKNGPAGLRPHIQQPGGLRDRLCKPHLLLRPPLFRPVHLACAGDPHPRRLHHRLVVARRPRATERAVGRPARHPVRTVHRLFRVPDGIHPGRRLRDRRTRARSAGRVPMPTASGPSSGFSSWSRRPSP